MSRCASRMVPIAAFVALAATTACSSDPDDGPEQAAESQDALLAGRRVPEHEVASMLRQAGFPEAVVGRMVCTAKYESSFYERASHHNTNGTTDYGLFQINSVHLGDPGCPSTVAGLYDGAANARCAYRVYRDQGIGAWYAYRQHRGECDRTPAP